MKLQCHGLNDFQVNGYLTKRGYKDIMNGWACVKGNTVTLKSGFIRLLVTRNHKNHSILCSMTEKEWKRLNLFRQWGMDVFLFITREYCVKKFVEKRRGNAPIPTDRDIIDNYSYEAVKDADGKKTGEWKYQPSHSALLHIKGMVMTLFDVNNNDEVDWDNPKNSFVWEFTDLISRYVLPRICDDMRLDLAEIRKFYSEYQCYYPAA